MGSRSYKRFMCLLLTGVFCGCGDEIVHNVTEVDANRILTQLHDSGINAQKILASEGKWSVSVPTEFSMDAMRQLDINRALLPAREDSTGSSFIPSREDQLYRFERQMSRGLEDTLKTLSGVLDARVHLNLPLHESLFGTDKHQSPTSASVLLVVTPIFLTNSAEVTAIVSGAAGVSSERVSVVINRTVSQTEGSGSARKLSEAQENNGYSSATLKNLMFLIIFIAITFGAVWMRKKALRKISSKSRAGLSTIQEL